MTLMRHAARSGVHPSQRNVAPGQNGRHTRSAADPAPAAQPREAVTLAGGHTRCPIPTHESESGPLNAERTMRARTPSGRTSVRSAVLLLGLAGSAAAG